MNDPANFNPDPDCGAMDFLTPEGQKAIAAMMNRLSSERDALEAALCKILLTCRSVNTVYQWSADQRAAVLAAWKLLARLGGNA